SWRARLLSATVLPTAPFFALPLSLPGCFPIGPFSHRMPEIRRSALVEHSASRMFGLVNDIPAYPRRFAWCTGAHVLEEGPNRMVARLDLRLGALRTWFTTENALS